MAEHLYTPTSEKNDKFENERNLELLLGKIFKEARKLQSVTYPSGEEAQRTINDFNESSLEQLRKIDNIAAIDLLLSGEGVRVPNVTMQAIESQDIGLGIGAIIDNDAPFVSLAPFETVEARIGSLHGSLAEMGDEGKHTIRLFAIAVLKEVASESVTVPGTNIPIMKMTVSRQALIDLSPNSVIEVDVLQKDVARKEMVEELAKLGIVNSLFKQQLNKLQQALYSEDPLQFTELTKLNFLYKLGELGAQQSRRSQQHSDAVSKAVLETIGDQRPLKITYKDPLESIENHVYVTGHLIEVLMPSSYEDSLEPTLIVEVKSDTSSEDQTFYAKIQHIQSLSF